MKRKFNLRGNSFSYRDGRNKGYSTYGKAAKTMEWVRQGGEATFFIDGAIVNAPYENRAVPKYAWLLESADCIPTEMDIARDNVDWMRAHFDLVFTHNRDLAAQHDFYRWVPAMGYWVTEPAIHAKSKLVSMISSNKNWLPGHRKRLEWVAKLRNQLDLYGHGFNYIKNVEDGLNRYMFSVAIENAESRGYFTEKILNCFTTGTVPVYIGAPDISDYFNAKGIIILEDGDDRLELNTGLYESMRPAIEDNFHLAQDYEMVEDYIISHYL